MTVNPDWDSGGNLCTRTWLRIHGNSGVLEGCRGVLLSNGKGGTIQLAREESGCVSMGYTDWMV